MASRDAAREGLTGNYRSPVMAAVTNFGATNILSGSVSGACGVEGIHPGDGMLTIGVGL